MARWGPSAHRESRESRDASGAKDECRPWCLLGVRSCHSRSTDMTMPSSSVPSASGLRQKIFTSGVGHEILASPAPHETFRFSPMILVAVASPWRTLVSKCRLEFGISRP
eukprot:1577777-Prymnesium_polylepis.1